MGKGNQDDLDRVLDAALAKYAAEPRAGLEERVLANLRAETARGAERAWWRWSVVAAVAAVLVIAVGLSWRTSRPTHLTTHVAVTTTTTSPAGTQVATSGEQSGVRPPAGRAARKAPKHPAPDAVLVSAHPKLDQFPSPHPLSEQEKLLRAFVAENPDRAVLIARARSEQLRQDQLEEMKAFPSRDQGTERNSDTTER